MSSGRSTSSPNAVARNSSLLPVLPILVLLPFRRRKPAHHRRGPGSAGLDRPRDRAAIGSCRDSPRRRRRGGCSGPRGRRGSSPSWRRWRAARRAAAIRPRTSRGASARARGQRLSDGLQVIPGIEPIGDRADILAEGLAIAQECGPGEHVDLGAGVVDVIFPGDLEAREAQEAARASPNTAPRPWPTCIGPVGLADTNSTLTGCARPLPARGRSRRRRQIAARRTSCRRPRLQR